MLMLLRMDIFVKAVLKDFKKAEPELNEIIGRVYIFKSKIPSPRVL